VKLTAINGMSLDLWVSGYQFPEGTVDENETNWLSITIRLDGFGKQWTSACPSLMTWELKSLIDWLQAILLGRNSQNEIKFTKPNLVFQLVEKPGGALIIRTLLDLESKPAWYDKKDPFFFDVEFDEKQIHQAVLSLEYQLKRFPSRGRMDYESVKLPHQLDQKQ
jgi:hypothetical protein